MQLNIGENTKLSGAHVQLSIQSLPGLNWLLIKSFANGKSGQVLDSKGLSMRQGIECLESVSLEGLEPDLEKLSLVMVRDKPMLAAAVTVVIKDGQETHQVSLADQERAKALLIVAEFYRHNAGWKVRNKSAGFANADQGMKDYFRMSNWRPSPSQRVVTENNMRSAPRASMPRQEVGLGERVMGFFDKVRGAMSVGRAELTAQVARYKNKTFMEGTVAICTYIGMASNGVDSGEKNKMLGFIQRSDELKVFSTSEVIGFYNKLESHYQFDPEVGSGETMKHIMALASKRDEAQLALRVGIAVAKSDGDFDNKERAAAKTICHQLGFDLADFDL